MYSVKRAKRTWDKRSCGILDYRLEESTCSFEKLLNCDISYYMTECSSKSIHKKTKHIGKIPKYLFHHFCCQIIFRNSIKSNDLYTLVTKIKKKSVIRNT